MGSIRYSEASGKPLPTGLPSIWESLETSALKWKDKLALACLHQPVDLYDADPDCSASYLRWTYQTLYKVVNEVAKKFARMGIQPGQSVATFLPKGAEFVIIFWAAHKLGCTFVPLNPITLLNTAETIHVLEVAKASVVILQDDAAAANIDSLALGLVSKFIVSGSRTGWTSFAELVKPDHHPAMTETTRRSKVVTVLFTSGTTSLPKGCPHSDLSLNAFMANLSLGGMSENDVFCSVLPNNHAMGYFYCLYFLCHGGAVVFPSAVFEAKAMLDALEMESCTHACLVPTALYALLQSLASRPIRPKLLLVDVCLAGASITPENMKQVVNELGSRGVSTGFGMTEGSPVWTAYVTDAETLIHGDMTLVGTASPGATIKICAPDSKRPLPRGQQGEMHQTGPGLISGYMGLTSDSFYEVDGRRWFVTGDQAVMYDDGLVSITGRYKDIIIRGGENIAPSSIEVILNRFDGLQVNLSSCDTASLTYKGPSCWCPRSDCG